MKDYILAIDQGTSGCKITIFNVEGQVIGNISKAYPTFYPVENGVEQNPNDWWKAIIEGIKELLLKENINPRHIKCIGVDGTSWALLPVDQKGDVLRRAMIWLDRRATKETQYIKDLLGEKEVIRISGNPVDPAYITPKILWMKENEPDIYKKTSYFLQSNGFIVYKLTGQLSQDYSQGYGFHFFNITKTELDKDMAKDLGISLDLIAPFKQCHHVVGTVTEEAAKLTGLIRGIPVVAGGLDAACCTLGAGVMEEGETQEQGGQAGGMSIALEEPHIHDKLILGCHVVPDRWLLQGGTTGGGGTLNWFNRELGFHEQYIGQSEGKTAFEVMSSEAKTISVGSDGVIFLPYMQGERSPIWNSHAKGLYYGLSFDKTRAHLIRSTMEGVAYSLLHNIDTAKEIGVTVNKMNSVGGSANSSIWTQIKSDVTGIPIDVPYSDHATSLGAAILAGMGVGLYNSFHEAIKKTVIVKSSYTPDEDHHIQYQKVYKRYLQLSDLLVKNIWINN